MPKPKEKPQQFYIVCCTDLHSAIGVFANVESAVKVARQATDNSKCVFLPVPIESYNEGDFSAKTKKVVDDVHVGQYL